MTRQLVAMASIALGMATASAAASPVVEPSGPESDLALDLVRLVGEAAELVASEGQEAACEEFSTPGPWFQGETYVFVLDMEGNALCHPSRPALEGHSLLDLKDPVGKPVVRNFLRELAEQDDGWVHYLWPRPEFLTSFWKTSYVRRARGPEGDEYMVGSGLYEIEMERFFVVEQVKSAVELIREQGEAAFDTLSDPSTGYLFYDAYVFVLDGEGLMLANVGFPELEGRNIAELKDVDGKPFVREMLDSVREAESAWVDYRWPRPGKAPSSRKSSYLHRLEREGRTYIVGAGVYFH